MRRSQSESEFEDVISSPLGNGSNSSPPTAVVDVNNNADTVSNAGSTGSSVVSGGGSRHLARFAAVSSRGSDVGQGAQVLHHVAPTVISTGSSNPSIRGVSRPMQALGYCRLVAARLGAFATCFAGLLHVFALSVPFVSADFSLPAKMLIFTGVALMVTALILGIFFQMQGDSTRGMTIIAVLLPLLIHFVCAVLCVLVPAAPSISLQVATIFAIMETFSLLALSWATSTYHFFPEEGALINVPECRARLSKQRRQVRRLLLARVLISFILKTAVFILWIIVNVQETFFLEVDVHNKVTGEHYSELFLGHEDHPNYAVAVTTLTLSVLVDMVLIAGWKNWRHAETLAEDLQRALLPSKDAQQVVAPAATERMRLVVGPASASMSFDHYLTASGTHIESGQLVGVTRAREGSGGLRGVQATRMNSSQSMSGSNPLHPQQGNATISVVSATTTPAAVPSQQQSTVRSSQGEVQQPSQCVAAPMVDGPPREEGALEQSHNNHSGASSAFDANPLGGSESMSSSNAAMSGSSETSNSGNPLMAPPSKSGNKSRVIAANGIALAQQQASLSPSSSGQYRNPSSSAEGGQELLFSDINATNTSGQLSSTTDDPMASSWGRPKQLHLRRRVSSNNMLNGSHSADDPTDSCSRPPSPSESISSISSAYNNKSITNMSKQARKQRLDEKSKDVTVAKEFEYKIGQQIGVGASASVFKGLMLHTGETTAVKVLRLDPTMKNLEAKVQELKNEIEILKALDHEHVVKYLFSAIKKASEVNIATPLVPPISAPSFSASVGAESSTSQQHLSAAAPRSQNELQMHIVMEYITGGSIQDVIKEHGRLEERTAVAYAVQIILGLDYLHSMGIAHRDIKSGNCLVSHEGIVKLADFGCSELLNDENNDCTSPNNRQRSATPNSLGVMDSPRKLSNSDRRLSNRSLRSGGVGTNPVGTPQFMAPEVIRGDLYTRTTPHNSSIATTCHGTGSPTIPLIDQHNARKDSSGTDSDFVLNTPVLLAADIWSFGCILMHMVTGEMPFAHISDQKFKIMHYVASDTGPVELPRMLVNSSPRDEGTPVSTPRRSNMGSIAGDSGGNRQLSSKQGNNSETLDSSLRSATQPPNSTHFSENLIDIITRCLDRDPLKRPTARELTLHPWFQDKKLIRSVSSAALTPLVPRPYSPYSAGNNDSGNQSGNPRSLGVGSQSMQPLHLIGSGSSGSQPFALPTIRHNLASGVPVHFVTGSPHASNTSVGSGGGPTHQMHFFSPPPSL